MNASEIEKEINRQKGIADAANYQVSVWEKEKKKAEGIIRSAESIKKDAEAIIKKLRKDLKSLNDKKKN